MLIVSVLVVCDCFEAEEETAAAAEHGPNEKDEDQEPGNKRTELEVPDVVQKPSAPVYCICRKPDINCFMM